jgi:hypothetical protein
MDAKRGGVNGGQAYAFPNDITPEFCFGIMTKRFKHDRNLSKTAVVGSHYVLPLPASIQDSQGIQYNTPEPGAIMAGLADAAMQVADDMVGSGSARAAGQALGRRMKGLASAVTARVSEMDAKTAVSGLQLAAQFAGAGDSFAAGAAGAFMGQVPNPNITAFFRGVSLRNHNFSWDLYPRSEFESVNLHNMIRALRRDSLPARPTNKFITDSGGPANRHKGVGISASPFLTYPLEAHITITTMGAQNTIRFKPAFIETISVNYAPGGVAFLKNGQPAGVQLTMSFKEVDIHTREDYEGEEVLTKGAADNAKAIAENPGLDALL